ncbi:MAG: outer membrane beta-barrel domain-containing protein [Bdellovibrionales bacterium]
MRTLLALLLVFSSSSFATPKSLERELKDLDVKEAVPSSKISERIYAVQERITPLRHRFEIGVSAAQNYTGSSFLDSSQFSGELGFHITDRWAAALAYSHVVNEFTKGARNLANASGFLPDVDYALSRKEARATYNAFYGKFRLSRTQALSFDQYIGLGVVQNDLQSGQAIGPVAEIGFAFWLGKMAAFRLGVKDYYYREQSTLSKGNTHNVHGYLQTGLLF